METQLRVFLASLQPLLRCLSMLHICLDFIGDLILLNLLYALILSTEIYTQLYNLWGFLKSLKSWFEPLKEPPTFDTLRAVTYRNGTYLYGRYAGGEECCICICRVLLPREPYGDLDDELNGYGGEEEWDSSDNALYEHGSKKRYERRPVEVPTEFDTMWALTLRNSTYLYGQYASGEECYVCDCKVMLPKKTYVDSDDELDGYGSEEEWDSSDNALDKHGSREKYEISDDV